MIRILAMDKWLKFGHASRLFWSLFAIALIPVVGVLDLLSSAEFTFSLVYLVPAIILAWVHGRIGALGASVATGALWLYVDFITERYAFSATAYVWNFVSRLIVQTALSLSVAALRASLSQQYRLARVDPLTGVFNRRGFEELAVREISRSMRYGTPLTLAYFDLDNFKHVNDTVGHAVGDRLLREFANALDVHLRATDIIVRLGGDEFAVLFTDCGAEGAGAAVGRILQAANETFAGRYPVSLSLGVVSYQVPPTSLDAMVQQADALMYEVKQGGKNSARFVVVP